MPFRLPRNVYLLGFLSLFNDLTADVITPLLPAYLATLGMGAGFLGIMEGLANCLSNITMLFSGWQTDRLGRGKKIAVAGYSLSALIRLLIAIPVSGIVLTARILDRIGKGIRTSPRDHLLTDSLDKKDWGKAFGVQRAMDHCGAILAPPLAFVLMAIFSVSLPQLFLIASLPALLSILIVPHLIKDSNRPVPQRLERLSWKRLPAPLKRYSLIIFLAGITTPSELFVILKMQDLGLKTAYVPWAWFVLTLMMLLASYGGGRLADAWSRRRTIGLGWFLFVIAYAGLALSPDLPSGWCFLVLYGIQSGLVEAAERTYPASLADFEARASALGWYYFAYGMGALPASLCFGLLWKYGNPQAAFLLYAGLTLLILPLLSFLPSDRSKTI